MKIKIFTLLSLALLFFNIGTAQVLFIESFDEAENATTGTSNDAGMVSWATAVPGGVAASDYFKVVAGQLEARDPNNPPATWTTDPISLTGCTGLEVSFLLSEESNMEECIDCEGTGAPCIDWLKMEYRLDGGSWLDFSGETCNLTLAPGEMIVIGDVPDGGPVTVVRPLCELTAASLELRITCLSWAASEYWRVDDVTVTCDDCAILPVALNYFIASAEDEEKKVELTWQTLSEIGSSHFVVERSSAGEEWAEILSVPAQETPASIKNYSVEDNFPLVGITHYRLKSVDLDGTFSYSAISVIKRSATGEELTFFPNPVKDYLTIRGQRFQVNTIEVYDLGGKRIEIDQPVLSGDEKSVRLDLTQLKPGIYLVKIGRVLQRIRR